MNIEIEPLTDENVVDPENCIFCDQPTVYWTRDPQVNRPVCPVCSVINTNADIQGAKFNY